MATIHCSERKSMYRNIIGWWISVETVSCVSIISCWITTSWFMLNIFPNDIRNETNIIVYVIIYDEQKVVWFQCEVLSMMRLMPFMTTECSFLFEVGGENTVKNRADNGDWLLNEANETWRFTVAISRKRIWALIQYCFTSVGNNSWHE